MEETSWYNNPELFAGPGCFFQAYGMTFNSEAFLQNTIFEPKLILYHGKLGLPGGLKSKIVQAEPESLQVFETTYLLLKLSEAGQSDVQLTEIIAFLHQYKGEIKRLREFPGVESVGLRFQPAEGEPSLETLPDEFFDLAGDVEFIMM